MSSQDSGYVPKEELDSEQMAELEKAAAAGAIAALVRVLCADGTMHRAIIGYGNDCTAANANADVNANAFCVTHGGTQKITRVKCPYP